jgi:hypothetical protein
MTTSLTLTEDKTHYDPNISNPDVSNLDEQQINMLLNATHQILERAMNVAEVMYDLDPSTSARGSVDRVYIDNDDGPFIWAEWSEYGNCGYHEEGTFVVPTEYLVNDDWHETEKKRIKEKKEKERLEREAKQERERLERERKKEEAERKKYLELKAKFEGDSE